MRFRGLLLRILHLALLPAIGVAINLKCENDLIAVIEGREESGIVITEDNLSAGYYERINDTHFRVCPCQIKTCFKKCCGRNEIMVNDSCQNAGDHGIATLDVDERFLPAGASNFYVIYGDGCPTKYYTVFHPDDYADVSYRVHSNGSLSILLGDSSSEHRVQDFCIEEMLGPGNYSTEILICTPKNFAQSIRDFPVGMAVSVPFLTSTLIVYSFRELRSTHGKNLMSHVASLLSAYLSTIAAELLKFNTPEVVCVILGFVRQFSFLSSFFWLNAMCFDVWWSLSSWPGQGIHAKSGDRKKFLIYCVCGWGCPAGIILVTAVMEFAPVPDSYIKPGIGFPNCFLTDGQPFYAYFYGPVIFVYCADVTLFILSAARFIAVKNKFQSADVRDKINIKATKARFFLLLKIFTMMGINWIIDPFSWIFQGSFYTWLFIHLSIVLQAVGIFVIFVCNAEVRKIVSSKLCIKPWDDGNTKISLLDAAPARTFIATPNDKMVQSTIC